MNRNIKMKALKYITAVLAAALCVGAMSVSALAEGSADMVKSAYDGTTAEKTYNKGYRSFIFVNKGTMWVGLEKNQTIKAYAYEGEKLYFAASVYSNETDITVTYPDGSVHNFNSLYDDTALQDKAKTIGFIKNRDAEAKGPNDVIQPEAAAAAHIANVENIIMPSAQSNTEFNAIVSENGINSIATGATTGGYYAHVITAPQSGVYYFNFSAEPKSNTSEKYNYLVTDTSDFVKQQEYNSARHTLAAFDITVTDKNDYVQRGRVFSDYFTLQVNGDNTNYGAWQHYYIATRDGYIYNFSLNGAMPYTYFLFANNRGLIGSATNASVYHSIKDVNNGNKFEHYKNLLNRYGNADGTYVMGPDNDPTDLDYAYHMFFNKPDEHLPEFVLAKPKAVGEVTSVEFEGEKTDTESNVGYSGDGGYFIVTTKNASSYQLIIDMSNMYVKKGSTGYSGATVNVTKSGTGKGNYTVTPSVPGHLDEIKLSTAEDLNFIYEDTETHQWYSIQTKEEKADGSWDQNPGGGADVVEYKAINKPEDLDDNYQTLGRVMLGNSSKSDDPAAKNKIFWNGRDQYGRVLPAGSYFGDTGRGKVYAQAKAGELHFPFIDCEKIPNGLSVFLENPPEGNTNYDEVSERSKLYYNNKNDSLLRQGDNIAAIKENWPTGSSDSNWDSSLENKLEYMWRINQSNNYSTVISEDHSIDGFSTYSGTSEEDMIASKLGSHMLGDNNLGVDHGISDTWTYILNDKIVEMKTEAKEGALTLYSEPQEKILKGFVFFDTPDTTSGSYDKTTNDRELPECTVEAFYGNVKFEADDKTPVSADRHATVKTDNTGNYSIPIDLTALNGGNVYIKITPPDNSYKITTDNDIQIIKLKDYTKSTYVADVGYTRIVTQKAVRIQTVWEPAALKSNDMSVTFDALGYNTTDLGGLGMENDELSNYSNNGSNESSLNSKTPLQKYEGLTVSSQSGNQITRNDFVGKVYERILSSDGEWEDKEYDVAYVVKQNISGSGFRLKDVDYNHVYSIAGDGSDPLYNWTFTNEVLPAKINETVWHDADRDGIKDSGEADLDYEKIKIKISKKNERGGYEGFTAVPADADETEKEYGVKIDPNTDYTLKYINGLQLPAGEYKLTVPPGDDEHIYCTDPGTKTGETGELTKASIDPETGYSVQEIKVEYGQTININVGYAVGSSIKGTVFIDSVTDGIMNGIMDSEEAPYRNDIKANITVRNQANHDETIVIASFDANHGEFVTEARLKAVPYELVVENPGVPDITKDNIATGDFIRFSIPPDNSKNEGNIAETGVQYTRSEDNKTLTAVVPVKSEKGINSTHQDCNIPLQRPFTVIYNAGAYHNFADEVGDKGHEYEIKTTKAWYHDQAKTAAPEIEEKDHDSYVTLGWAEINQEPGLVSNWTRDTELNIITEKTAAEEQYITRDMTFYAVAAADNYGNIGKEGENAGKHIGDDIPDYMQVIYDGNKPEGAEGDVENVPNDENKYPNPHTEEAKATVTVKLEEGEIPAFSGYTFMGWAMDPISTTADYPYPKADGKTTFVLPDEGEILYAVWSKQYQVTYDMNKGLVDGASGTAPVDDAVHLHGDKVDIKQPEGAKTGTFDPVFVGWSTAPQSLFDGQSANKELVDQLAVQNYYSAGEDGKFLMPDNSITLYAMWAEDLNGSGYPDYEEPSHNLAFNFNSALDNDDQPVADKVISNFVKDRDVVSVYPYGGAKDTNKYIHRNANEIFVGWSKELHVDALTAEEGKTAEDLILFSESYPMPDDDLTLYAVWAIDENNDGSPDYLSNSNHVSYNINGGELRDGVFGTGSIKDPDDNDGVFYTCQHHHVEGTMAQLYAVDVAKSLIQRDKAVLIGWSKKKYDVFASAPDSAAEESFVTEISIEEYDEDKDLPDPNMVYAVWASDTNNNNIPDYDDREPKYKVTYYGNEHTGGGVPVDDNEYIYGQEAEAMDNTNTLTREGCMFLGWTSIPSMPPISRSASQVAVDALLVNKFTVTGNVNLYALWAEDSNGNGYADYTEVYTFRYDVNGGKGTAPNELTGLLYGESIIISGCDLTMPAEGDEPACVFVGWSTDEAVRDMRYTEKPYKTVGDSEKKDIVLYQTSETVKVDDLMDFADKDNVITAYAVWAVDKNNNGIADYNDTQYTLTYDMQDSLGETSDNTAPVDNESYIEGDIAVLHEYTGDKPQKKHAVFAGWSINSEAKDNIYSERPADGILLEEGSNYTVSASDADEDNAIKVYAVWADDKNENGTPDYNEEKYMLSFIYNDALDRDTDEIAPDYRYEGLVAGESVATDNIISVEYFNKKYYRNHIEGDTVVNEVFIGWSLTQHKEAFTTSLDDIELLNTYLESGHSVTIPEEGGDIKVYALWAEDRNDDGKPDYSADTYHIRYYLNGGEPGRLPSDPSQTLESLFHDDDEKGFGGIYGKYYIGGNSLAEGTKAVLLTKAEQRDVLFTRDKAVLIGWSQENLNVTYVDGEPKTDEDGYVIFTDLTSAPEDGKLIDNFDVQKYDEEEDDKYPNYVFAVWAKDDNSNGVPDYDEEPHSVLYDGNGGTGEAPVDSDKYYPDVDVVLKDKASLERTQAVFMGWSLFDGVSEEARQIPFDKTTNYEQQIKPILVTSPMKMAKEDVILYAVWADDKNGNSIPDYEETYSFVYDVNDFDSTSGVIGSAPASVDMLVADLDSVNVVSAAEANKLLTKKDSVFIGWSHQRYTQNVKNGEAVPEYINMLPDEDGVITYAVRVSDDTNKDKLITVYAVWADDMNHNGQPDCSEPKYKVAYDLNGGESDAPPVDNSAYMDGNIMSVNTDDVNMPHKKDALFLGWSLTQADVFTSEPEEGFLLGDTYQVSPADAAEGVITFYAVWAADRNNNGTPDYSERTYRVTYDANYSGTDTPTVPLDTSVYISGDSVIVSDAELSARGLKFLGWSRDKQAVYEKFADKGTIRTERSFTIGSANVILYAVWADDNNLNGGNGVADFDEIHTFRYSKNGGELAEGMSLPADRNYLIPNDTVTINHSPSDAISREGCIQIGWSTDERTADTVFAEAPSADIRIYRSAEQYTVMSTDPDIITAYAVWAEDKNANGVPDYEDTWHTVTYDLNGHGDSFTDDRNYVENDVVTLADAPKAEGVVFLGWSRFAGIVDFDRTAVWQRVNGVAYEKDSVVMGKEDITLYAVWAKDENLDAEGNVKGNGVADYLETYTITYNANGGKGNPPADIPYVLPGDRIGLAEVPYAGLLKDGSVQTGWTLSKGTDAGKLMQSTEENVYTYVVNSDNGEEHYSWLDGQRVRDHGTIEIKAVWETDNKGGTDAEGNDAPDGIPDRYQKEIVFRVVNGTWAETGNNEDIIVYALLTDEKGELSEDGKCSFTPPTPVNDYGYMEEGSWDNELPEPPELTGNDRAVYTYTFVKQYNVSIHYNEYEEGRPVSDELSVRSEHNGRPLEYGFPIVINPNGGTWTQEDCGIKDATEIIPVAVESESLTLNKPVREGYIFLGWTESEDNDTDIIEYVYTAQWLDDLTGPEGASDGIPDIYQKRVIFGIVNGSWNGRLVSDEADKDRADKIKWTELKDSKTGLWSLEAEVSVEDIIPDLTNAKPDDAYANSAGKWYPEPVSVSGAGDEKFNYIYMDETNPNTVYKSAVHNSTVSDLATDPVSEFGREIAIDPNGGMYMDSGDTVFIPLTDYVTALEDPIRENYVFMGWSADKYSDSAHPDAVRRYTALWEADVLGDGGTSDGIPDIYQKPVVFEVVHGTWESEGSDTSAVTRYAELTDSITGYWSGEDDSAGSIVNIPIPKPSEGYKGGNWYKDGDLENPVTPVRSVKGKAELKYTYIYEPIVPSVTYSRFIEGARPETDTDEGFAYNDNIQLIEDEENSRELILHADEVIPDPAPREGYVFLGWISEKQSEGEYACVYTAQWLEDKAGGFDEDGSDISDGIPDIYQKRITFDIENGVWLSTGNAERITVFAELKKDGKWSADGEGNITVPGHRPDYKYDQKAGSWLPSEPPETVNKDTEPSFRYVYTLNDSVSVSYREYKSGSPAPSDMTVFGTAYGTELLVEPNGGIWTDTVYAPNGTEAIVPVTAEKDIALSDPSREGYIFLGWIKAENENTPDKEDYIFTAQWLENKTGENDTPDDIPDIYQKRVEFRIVNGTWDEAGADSGTVTVYVELTRNGLWDENGSGAIPSDIMDKISEPHGKDGFVNGKWYPEAPASIVNGSSNEVYTYIFVDPSKYDPVYKSAVYSLSMSDMDTEQAPFGSHIVIDPAGGTWTHSVYAPQGTDKTVSFDVSVENSGVDTLNDPVRDGNVFMGWNAGYDEASQTYTFTAMWSADVKGDDGVSDGIPDEFQKPVSFIVRFGKWTGENTDELTLYAELKDSAGRWSHDGSGTISAVPVPTPNIGYTNGEWSGKTPSRNVEGRAPETFIFVYYIDTPAVVYTGFNDWSAPSANERRSFNFGNSIKLDTNGGTIKQSGMLDDNMLIVTGETILSDPEWSEHVFMGWQYEQAVSSETSGNTAGTFTAQWLEDKLGGFDENGGSISDGIPDIYQKAVSFSIEGGVWAETRSDDVITVYVELKDENGNWSGSGSGRLTAPTPVNSYGFTANGSWEPELTDTVDSGSPDMFKYTFVRENNVGVGHDPYRPAMPLTDEIQTDYLPFGSDILIDPDGGSWTQPVYAENGTTGIVPIKLHNDIVLSRPVRNGYVFMGWARSENKNSSGETYYIYTAKWLEDNAGAFDENGGGIPDGIPDIYEKRITLRVENGSWNAEGDREDIVLYAVLSDPDDEGRWSADGTGTIVLPEGMMPDEGYTAESGHWDTDGSVKGNEPETFVYSFGAGMYTLTFDPGANGAKPEGTEYDITAEYNSEVVVPEAPIPVENCYEFTGWSCGGNVYLPGESIIVKGDMTFTAEWTVHTTPSEPSAAAYRIEYYRQALDGSYELYESEFPLYGEIGSIISIDAPKTYEGYMLNESVSQLSGVITAPAEGKEGPVILTLRLYYDIQGFRVTYDLNGGTGGPDDTECSRLYPKGSEVTLWRDTSPSSLTRDNMAFVGWSGEAVSYPLTTAPEEGMVLNTVLMPENGITVYALWAEDMNGNGIPDYRENKYGIAYDLNGGGGDAVSDERTYFVGENVTLVPADNVNISREGAVFTGWSETLFGAVQSTDQAYLTVTDSVVMPEGGITVHAVWAADENGNGVPDYDEAHYRLCYDGNGYTDGYIPEDEKEYIQGARALLISGTDLGLARNGEVFAGWSTEQYDQAFAFDQKDEAESVIIPYNSVEMPDSDLTVYAVWAADENANGKPDYAEEGYHILYYANGGTDVDGNAFDNDLFYTCNHLHPSGYEVILMDISEAGSLVHENALLIGWSETPYGIVYTQEDYDGAVLADRVITGSEDTAVYAVWAADENANGIPDYAEDRYAVSYDLNGGNGGPDESVLNELYLAGTKAVLWSDTQPSSLLRDKAVFIGWSRARTEAPLLSAPEDGAVITEVIVPEGGITVYALWAEDINGNGVPDYDDSIYTVTYEWADGTVPSGAVLPQPEKVLRGMSFTPAVLSNVGNNKFLGWFTDKTAQNAYTDGSVSSDITLYGKWEYTSGSSGGGGGGGAGVKRFTITAETSEGGRISPEGKVSVKSGESLTFTITPDEGYIVRKLVIDGKDADASYEYTFEKVTADHTISAVFEINNKGGGTASDDEEGIVSDSVYHRDVPAAERTGVADWLNTVDHNCYMYGYEDGTFAPDRNITRAEVAQLFFNLLTDKAVDISSGFDDVNENAWYAEAVNTLASLGIIEGVGNNRFEPTRNITRAEFTAIAMRFAKLDNGGENIFSDVSEDKWYYDVIVGSVKYGWISGYLDGTFRPDNTITRAETTVIVNRMLDRRADKDFISANDVRSFTDILDSHWAYYEIMEATNGHTYDKAENEIWKKLIF